MIIDRVRLAGESSYLKDATGSINLASVLPSIARTPPVGRGEQLEISEIQILIEGNDLWPLFQRQNSELIRISVIKEIFPALFADPYRNRIHSIGGFADLNDGAFENCRALDVDGEPTLVCMQPGDCKWTSRQYALPAPADFVRAAWSLASARQTGGFSYGVAIDFDHPDNTITNFVAAQNRATDLPRNSALQIQKLVRSLKIEFSATVTNDGYFHEHHVPVSRSQTGRPLLRAIHLLEPVNSPNDFLSLHEMIAGASQYDMFGATNSPIQRISITIPIGAVVVWSARENAPTNDYEHVAVEIDPGNTNFGLSYLSMRLSGEILKRPPQDTGA